jgi:hypothetical protein
MIVSISGGALQPALMGQLVEKVGISTGWWLTTGCFVLVWSYPIAINLISSFRGPLDLAESGIDTAAEIGTDEESGQVDPRDKSGFRTRVFGLVTLGKKNRRSG